MFNSKDSIIVISLYPPRGNIYGGKLGGVSGFGKNTAVSIARNTRKKIIVICEKLGKYETYNEGSVTVVRAFDRYNALFYYQITRELIKLSKVDNILIEFEFSSYGGLVTTSFLPLFLLFLKLFKKKTTFALHQVVLDLSVLTGHIGLHSKNIKTGIMNFFLKIFYISIGLFSYKVVVLEQVFKNRLYNFINSNKLVVIPHGTDLNFRKLSKKNARHKLGAKQKEFVLLFFGFLTWYKGVDLLIKSVTGDKNLKLIIAGGESPTQKGKPHYERFLQKVNNLASKNKNIQITGFVSEKDLPIYFTAADLVVLPYRTMISSSGPLSLAFSFGKPVLLSNQLKGYLYSEDFLETLKASQLTPSDIFFDFNSGLLKKRINGHLNNNFTKKLEIFSQVLARKRNYNRIAASYVSCLK